MQVPLEIADSFKQISEKAKYNTEPLAYNAEIYLKDASEYTVSTQNYWKQDTCWFDAISNLTVEILEGSATISKIELGTESVMYLKKEFREPVRSFNIPWFTLKHPLLVTPVTKHALVFKVFLTAPGFIKIRQINICYPEETRQKIKTSAHTFHHENYEMKYLNGYFLVTALINPKKSTV